MRADTAPLQRMQHGSYHPKRRTRRQKGIAVQRDDIAIPALQCFRRQGGIGEALFDGLALNQLEQGFQTAPLALSAHMQVIGHMVDPFPLQIEKLMPCAFPKGLNRAGGGRDDLAVVAHGAGQAIPIIAQQQKVQIGVGIGAVEDGQLLHHGESMSGIEQQDGANHQRALFVGQPFQLHSGNHMRLGPALINPEEKLPPRFPENQGKGQPQPPRQAEKSCQSKQKRKQKPGQYEKENLPVQTEK